MANARISIPSGTRGYQVACVLVGTLCNSCITQELKTRAAVAEKNVMQDTFQFSIIVVYLLQILHYSNMPSFAVLLASVIFVEQGP